MNRPEPTILGIWLQSSGLALFALACWVIVSAGLVAAAVGWVLMLPGRVLSKAEGGRRKEGGRP